MNHSPEIQAILRRAAAMTEACGLPTVTSAVVFCSLWSLQGAAIAERLRHLGIDTVQENQGRMFR